jgi:hypothetical protein
VITRTLFLALAFIETWGSGFAAAAGEWWPSAVIGAAATMALFMAGYYPEAMAALRELAGGPE